MVIADEAKAFNSWSLDPNKWMNNSIYAYYETIFDASKRAVKGGRRSTVFKGSVANTTSKFAYYVPNQWQGTFDQYIEVSQMCRGIHFALKKKRIRQMVFPLGSNTFEGGKYNHSIQEKTFSEGAKEYRSSTPYLSQVS